MGTDKNSTDPVSGPTPQRWTANGLVFGSRLFRAVVKDYGLKQEYITPYTPEQNGLAERFIRSLKEECVWQHNFQSIDQARSVIARWIAWYNSGRPHQALKYKITGCRSRAAEDGRGLGKRQNGVVHHLSHEEKRPEPFNSAGRRPWAKTKNRSTPRSSPKIAGG